MKRKLMSKLVNANAILRFADNDGIVTVIQSTPDGRPMIDLTTGSEKILFTVRYEDMWDEDGNHLENDL